jgi:hypothetical protein
MNRTTLAAIIMAAGVCSIANALIVSKEVKDHDITQIPIIVETHSGHDSISFTLYVRSVGIFSNGISSAHLEVNNIDGQTVLHSEMVKEISLHSKELTEIHFTVGKQLLSKSNLRLQTICEYVYAYEFNLKSLFAASAGVTIGGIQIEPEVAIPSPIASLLERKYPPNLNNNKNGHKATPTTQSTLSSEGAPSDER